MNKIQEAQQLLGELGLPKEQQNEMSALTLLALVSVKPKENWYTASRSSLTVTKGVMAFTEKNYKRKYAPNTRETFRRQVLHQFCQAGIADYNPDSPSLPVNSPKAHYAVSDVALELIKTYKTPQWAQALSRYKANFAVLKDIYYKERELEKIPVKLPNGAQIKLSPGKHNKLQAAIIEQFASRFAKDSVLLYLGDTEKKNLFTAVEELESLGIPIDKHSKLPDILIYCREKRWLYLIEAVTSHGPISPKRFEELEVLLKTCKAGKIYVSAFPSFKEFKRYTDNLAWETEVWIMEFPDHLIHFNGDKFIGPR